MLRPAPRTHRHALTRTLGPTHTRRAPRPPPLSPSVLGASDFISCFLDFNLPGQASPCPGRANLSGLELSGVPSPRLAGVGSSGRLSPPPSGSEEPRPRPRRPEGRSRGQRPSVAAHARSLPLPARHPGPRAGPLSPGPRRPALRPTLKKFTSCGWLNAERVGSSPYPPTHTLSLSHLTSGRNVVPLGGSEP